MHEALENKYCRAGTRSATNVGGGALLSLPQPPLRLDYNLEMFPLWRPDVFGSRHRSKASVYEPICCVGLGYIPDGLNTGELEQYLREQVRSTAYRWCAEVLPKKLSPITGDNAQLRDLNPAAEPPVGRDPLRTTGQTPMSPRPPPLGSL
jgi:hypothetical protein